jgi:hypothetical protein
MSRFAIYVVRMLLPLALLGSSFARADEAVFDHPVSGRVLLDTILVQPSRSLANAKVLQGRFTHRKYLPEIPQPLTAQGDFAVGRELGVYWHTQTPFDSVFLLTQQGMIQRDEGKETMRVASQDQPGVRVIADIFLALFTLDIATLSASFDLYGQISKQPQTSQWTVGLKPKSNAAASLFKHAIISGDKDVRQVVLADKHGDRTVIDLESIVHSGEITPAVRALFNR